MAMIKSWRLGLGFVITLSAVGVVYFGYYFCQGPSCALKGNTAPSFKSNYDAYFAGRFLQNRFSESELGKDYDVDLDNQDVIVFLHIQKTGGTTFGRHLVENLEVDPPCNCYKRVKKRCDCLNKDRQVWLFSRYSTGWKCGLHADWTELKTCVDQWFQTNYGNKKRRYYYITLLRDPLPRFLSEWMHVRRGATWKTAALRCNGREATLQEVPFCYSAEDWTGVTLKEFMECKHNLAFNRQTRMLANLSKVNCYNTSGLTPSERDRLMLDSAKENLIHLAFFGLVEFQTYTQFLFEHTLNLNFIDDFVQLNTTHSSKYSVLAEEKKRMAELNHLDIELYQFAKDLFLQRVKQAYLDDGLPVPPELEHLRSSQAVEVEGGRLETGEGSLTSPGQNLPSQSDRSQGDESQREIEKGAVAEQFAKDIFQRGQIPNVPRTPELPAGWVDDNFLGSDSMSRPARGRLDAEPDFRSRDRHRLSRSMPSRHRGGGSSQMVGRFPESQQRWRGYR